VCSSDLYRQSFQNKLDSIQKSYNAGLASKYDYLVVQLSYKNSLPALTKLQDSLSISRDQFYQLLNTDNTNYELIGELMDATNTLYPDLSETNAFDIICSNDVALYGTDVLIESAKINHEITRAAQIPTLSASFNYNLNYKLTNNSETNRNFQGAWTAGLTLSIPLDSLLPMSRPSQSMKESDDTVEKLKISRDQYLNGLLIQLRTQRMQIEETRQTMTAQYDTITQNDLNVTQLKQRYQAGTASAQDVSDAELSLNQAKLNYLQSIYDYYSAIIKYNRMVMR
jgi:outer membrane protein